MKFQPGLEFILRRRPLNFSLNLFPLRCSRLLQGPGEHRVYMPGTSGEDGGFHTTLGKGFPAQHTPLTRPHSKTRSEPSAAAPRPGRAPMQTAPACLAFQTPPASAEFNALCRSRATLQERSLRVPFSVGSFPVTRPVSCVREALVFSPTGVLSPRYGAVSSQPVPERWLGELPAVGIA